MTRILEDTKLDYKDVLIVPKRSSLSSRNDVSLTRTFNTVNSGLTYSGIPLTISNMDGTGTFEMANIASKKYKLLTALIKHYPVEELVSFFNSNEDWACDSVCYSMGITASDLEKYNKFKLKSYAKLVMIDTANFYIESALDFLKRFREENKNIILIVGNIATAEMAEALILAGADVVKCGVGCFNRNTLISTEKGQIPIEQIVKDDLVLSHDKKFHKVIETYSYINNKKMISINGTISTKDHKYYVIHKKYLDSIKTDEDIKIFAEYIEAEKLTSEYKLIKLKM